MTGGPGFDRFVFDEEAGDAVDHRLRRRPDRPDGVRFRPERVPAARDHRRGRDRDRRGRGRSVRRSTSNWTWPTSCDSQPGRVARWPTRMDTSRDACLADSAEESVRPADDPPEAASSASPATDQRALVAARQGTLDAGVRDALLPGVRSIVRMTQYRTGQVVGDERGDDASRTGTRPGENRHEQALPEQPAADGNELRSIALTTRFLALCGQHGSEQLTVSIVAAGRSAGVPGLPQSNDWTAWNADEMRAAMRDATTGSRRQRCLDQVAVGARRVAATGRPGGRR